MRGTCKKRERLKDYMYMYVYVMCLIIHVHVYIGPGNDHYDYGQLLKFMLYPLDNLPSSPSSVLPCGCNYIFYLL